MADNVKQYGIRWATGYNGRPHPQAVEMAVASAANFTVSGYGTNVNLNVGDPVKISSDGTVSLAGGNENGQTSQPIWGIVVGMGGQGYFNGTRMVRSPYLPSGVTYGTAIDRQSKVLVAPASQGFWEIDCDDIVTATTYLGYQAFIGENCDHQLVPAAATAITLSANPVLDIGSHNPATAGLSFRIVGVSQNFANQDFAGQWVKLIVSVNDGAEPFFTNVGT
jgi:hypothetical protein